VSTRRVAGDVHRIISSRFPPVNVFDGLADPAELDSVSEVEGLTNDRLREELGQLNLVAAEDRRVGPGWGPVMAAFCHPNPEGSRFSDGTYGVYYAGCETKTALAESIHHKERFLRASAHMPASSHDMRRYVCRLAEPMTTLPTRARRRLLDPDSYAASSAFARGQRARNVWGLVYDSVRDPGGTCVAVFRPPALTQPQQASHYRYYWDGSRISHFDELTAAFEVLPD
jgi:hypothetical protein